MKCPKCGKNMKWYYECGKNMEWYYEAGYLCACSFICKITGTGEVFGETEQLKSRSVQRREALQKGEPMPAFDKPEILPPGDPDRCSDCGCNLDKPAGTECNVKHEDKPETPTVPSEIWVGIDPDGVNTVAWFDAKPRHFPTVRFIPETNSLPADTVRELVRLHEDFRDLLLKYRFTPGVPDELNAKAEEIDNLQSALFPEGLESEVKDE